MKLFETMPPFERHKQHLESLFFWQRLKSDQRNLVLDVLGTCCDLGRPPFRVDWLSVSKGIAMAWKPRSGVRCSIIYNPSNAIWYFITTRLNGISEAFQETRHFGSAVSRLFGKTDRLVKEEEEKCVS